MTYEFFCGAYFHFLFRSFSHEIVSRGADIGAGLAVTRTHVCVSWTWRQTLNGCHGNRSSTQFLEFMLLFSFCQHRVPRLRSSPGRYNISTLAVSTLRVVILKSLAMEISFPPSPSQHQESEWKMCAKLLDKEADEEPRRWWDSHPLLRAALIFPFA